MKKKQGGFLYWFLIPALVGDAILTGIAIGVTPKADTHAAVQTQSGPVATAGGQVNTN
ncbi:MAG TPA: hypothetical protein VF523_12930 [Burkholderiales bacterium]